MFELEFLSLHTSNLCAVFDEIHHIIKVDKLKIIMQVLLASSSDYN